MKAIILFTTTFSLLLLGCKPAPLALPMERFVKIEKKIDPQTLVEAPEATKIPAACDYWQSLATDKAGYRFVNSLEFNKDSKLIGRFNLQENPALHYGVSLTMAKAEYAPPTVRQIKHILDNDPPASLNAFKLAVARMKASRAVKEIENLENALFQNPPEDMYDLDDPLVQDLKKMPRGNIDFIIFSGHKIARTQAEALVPGLYGGEAADISHNPLVTELMLNLGRQSFQESDWPTLKHLQQPTSLFVSDNWFERSQNLRLSLDVLNKSAQEPSADEEEQDLCRFLIAQRLTSQILSLSGFKNALVLDEEGRVQQRFLTSNPVLKDAHKYQTIAKPGLFAEVADQEWILKQMASPDPLLPKFAKEKSSVQDFLGSSLYWLELAKVRDLTLWSMPVSNSYGLSSSELNLGSLNKSLMNVRSLTSTFEKEYGKKLDLENKSESKWKKSKRTFGRWVEDSGIIDNYLGIEAKPAVASLATNSSMKFYHLLLAELRNFSVSLVDEVTERRAQITERNLPEEALYLQKTSDFLEEFKFVFGILDNQYKIYVDNEENVDLSNLRADEINENYFKAVVSLSENLASSVVGQVPVRLNPSLLQLAFGMMGLSGRLLAEHYVEADLANLKLSFKQSSEDSVENLGLLLRLSQNAGDVFQSLQNPNALDQSLLSEEQIEAFADPVNGAHSKMQDLKEFAILEALDRYNQGLQSDSFLRDVNYIGYKINNPHLANLK